MATAASAAIGGPLGVHARPHRWLTPLVTALALTAATFTLGAAADNACAQGAWWDPPRQFANLCYSDLPYAYVNGGAERVPPLSDSDGRYPPPTAAPATAVLTYAAGLVTSMIVGWPDAESREDRPLAEVAADPEVRQEAVVYVGVAATLLLLAALATTWCLVRTHRNRPWDAVGFAVAPVLALSATIGWDLMSVGCVAGALLAWSRKRVVGAGVLIGVGTALAVYPVIVLGALATVAIRAGRTAAVGRTAAAALISWAAIMVPAYVLAPSSWLSFDDYLSTGVGNGSLWALLPAFGIGVSATLATQLTLISGIVLVVSLTWLALSAPRRPRLPQLALLLMLAVLLVSKEYAPQYALWLLPLAVLARPYWRDLLIWQAAEVFYFLAIWWHLGGYTDGGANGVDEVYSWAIATRVLAQLWLAGVVVRDIRQPWIDPVRVDALTDDPAGGVVDHALDVRALVR
ncbi:glycosyltransferase 87 family protein [soil metagenome]